MAHEKLIKLADDLEALIPAQHRNTAGQAALPLGSIVMLLLDEVDALRTQDWPRALRDFKQLVILLIPDDPSQLAEKQALTASLGINWQSLVTLLLTQILPEILPIILGA